MRWGRIGRGGRSSAGRLDASGGWFVADRSAFVPVVVVALALAGNAMAADRNVNIINSTSTTIKMFFASNVDVKKWEEDILGDDVLRPDDSIQVNIDDGTGHCTYDFRALLSDGSEIVKHDINVCRIGEFYFSE